MNNEDQRDRIDQDVAHRRMLSAVVGLAIRDACAINGSRFRDDTRTAISFLFEHSDGYLEMLDIDPKQFRERLLAAIFKNPGPSKRPITAGLTSVDLDRFANNYRRWWREKSNVYLRNKDEHNEYH